MKLPPLPEGIRAGRLTGWSADRAERRDCPVCGANDPRPLVTRPDGFVVHVCGCGMVYLAEVPATADLDALYTGYGEFKNFADVPMSASEMRVEIAADPFLSILERTGGIAGRALCEIGCSSGRFLELARRLGAEVYGVELDEKARIALDRKGIPASPGFPAGKTFDIICAFHVLEHLTTPDGLVAASAAALKVDGRFLAAVPNGGEAERVGPPWIGFRVDLEHLNYFSLKTLAALLSRRGLWVEQWWERDQPDVQRPRSVGAGLIRRIATRLRGITDPGAFRAGNFNLVALARRA